MRRSNSTSGPGETVQMVQHPWDMFVCFPTFTIKNQLNVAENIWHGSLWVWLDVVFFFFPGSLCFSSSSLEIVCHVDLMKILKCSKIMNTTLHKTNNSSLHFAMIHIAHEGFLSPWFTFHETNGNDSPLKNAGKETYKLSSEFGAVRPIFRGEVCWEGKLSEFLWPLVAFKIPCDLPSKTGLLK